MIKCISCRFAKLDKGASDSKWKAYECSNPKSEYHRALLNIKCGECRKPVIRRRLTSRQLRRKRRRF